MCFHFLQKRNYDCRIKLKRDRIGYREEVISEIENNDADGNDGATITGTAITELKVGDKVIDCLHIQTTKYN